MFHLFVIYSPLFVFFLFFAPSPSICYTRSFASSWVSLAAKDSWLRPLLRLFFCWHEDCRTHPSLTKASFLLRLSSSWFLLLVAHFFKIDQGVFRRCCCCCWCCYSWASMEAVEAWRRPLRLLPLLAVTVTLFFLIVSSSLFELEREGKEAKEEQDVNDNDNDDDDEDETGIDAGEEREGE